MTDNSLSVIQDVMASVAFKEALQEFVNEEIRLRTAYLRDYVRDNQIPRAAIIEGELGLLDELPALLDKYARKYQPNRP